MAEVSAAVPLLEWLRRQRRMSELQLELMTDRFDFDGAVQAEQPELAWWSMLRIVTGAARLYLCERGVNPPEGLDFTADTRVLLERLSAIDASLATRLWECLLKPAPPVMSELMREAHAGIRLAVDAFGAKQLDRDASVRDWADGVRLLREVATGLQIAGADKWYLRAEESAAAGLGWYDDVMAHLSGRSK